MAFPIPSFLQFAPPEEAIADIGRLRESALNREQNREINLAELGLKRQQLGQQAAAQAAQQAERMQEMEFRQLALQSNMTRDAAALAQEKAKMDAEAQVAMIQFQGMQDFQRDIANKVPWELAMQRNIGKITHGNPAAFTSFANSLQRTKTQEEIAAEKAQNQFEMANFVQGKLDARLGTVEEGKNTRAAEAIAARLKAAEIRAKNVASKLNQAEKADMDYRLEQLLYDFKTPVDEKVKQREAIIDEFDSKIKSKEVNPAQTKTSGKFTPGQVYPGKNGTKARYNEDGTWTQL